MNTERIDVLAVLRGISNDPAEPVYLMKNLLCLGHGLAAAKTFRTRKAAERFLKENPEFTGLHPQTVTRREYRAAIARAQGGAA